MTRTPPTAIDTTTPVVVFRAQNYSELGMVRTLGRMGVKVICIDHDPKALAIKSRYCAGHFDWDADTRRPEETVEFLIKLAHTLGQKPVLLPTFDTRNLLVDRFRDVLSSSYLLPLPQSGAMASLYSKQSMDALCRREGVPTPKTIFPLSLEQALQQGPSLGFPLVVKGIDSDRLMHRTGRRMAVVQTLDALRAAYNGLDEPGFNNLELQEYIPGGTQDTWMLSAYIDKQGDCRFAITGQKLRQFPIHGGVTTLGVCAPCVSMTENIARLAKGAGYRGILDADFCHDRRDGLWKLVDVNPRPGANFRLFVDKHGLDVVRAQYLDLTGQSVPVVEPVWGRRWMVEDKDLNAFRDHSLEGTLTLREWLKSLRGVSEFAHLATDDLRPSVAFARSLLSYHAERVVRRLWPF